MQRRQLLKAVPALGLGGLTPWAHAANYPNRPVTIVIPFGAGGNADMQIRLVANHLSQRMGVPFVVQNMPGAGGIAGGQRVVQSAPDGYTLLLGASSNIAMTPHLFNQVPFDVEKDLEPISLLSGHFGFLLVASTNLGINTFAEFVAAAKASPGKFNIGTTQTGSALWVAAELLKKAANVDCVTVPFRTSGEVVTALRSGTIQFMIDTIPPMLAQMQAGHIRALAVTSAERFPALPQIPTIRESGVDYDCSSWNGLLAPRGTPTDILDTLNAHARAVLEIPEVREQFLKLGLKPEASSRADFAKLIRTELDVWRKNFERTGVKKT